MCMLYVYSDESKHADENKSSAIYQEDMTSEMHTIDGGGGENQLVCFFYKKWNTYTHKNSTIKEQKDSIKFIVN